MSAQGTEVVPSSVKHEHKRTRISVFPLSINMERPDFVPFFREVIDHPSCTPSDAILFGYIYWLTKLKNEKCFASNEILAELCKSTPTSVRNSLTTLERAGFIRRSYEEGNPHKGRLEIIPLLAFVKVAPTGASRYHPQVLQVAPTGAQNKSIEKEQLNTAKADLISYSEESEEESKPRTHKDKEALALRAKGYRLLEKEHGVAPTPTFADYSRILEARKVLKDSDILTMVDDALSKGKAKTLREMLTARAIDIYRQENL